MKYKYPTDGITVRLVQMTPEWAAQLLAQNPKNRLIRGPHVDTFVHILEREEWGVDPSAVSVDRDSNLVNGQHRLTAIVQTGETVPVLLLEGLETDAILRVDTGAMPRSVHQQLTLMGVKSGTLKTATCKLIMNYDEDDGPTGSTEKQTIGEYFDLASSDEMIDMAISYASSLAVQVSKTKTAGIAMCYYLLLNAWPEKVDEFHEGLSLGIGLSKGDPILKLRNYLLTMPKQGTYLERRRVMGTFLKCFNHWVDDRKLEILTFRVDEIWPTPYTEKSHAKAVLLRERGAKSHVTRKANA